MDDFEIAGERVAPGEFRTVELTLPSLYTHTELNMPLQVMRGKRRGPTLFVSAAVHGDEINGVEIIRRLLGQRALKRLRGTLIAVPIVNVYGFIHQTRYLPDRRDLNRSFPGLARGSLAARLAQLFMEEVVARSDYGVDLHSAAIHRFNLPQIRACLDDATTERMARSFHVPVVLDSDLRDGSLRQAVHDMGKPLIVYEAGEALRFDELAIRAGVRGLLAVMRELGMLPKSRRRRPYAPVVARASLWVRSPQSGILRLVAPLGSRVARGDLLGYVADPYGQNEAEVHASASGVVIGRNNLPLVNEGEAIVNVARFADAETVAASVEAFQAEFDPGGGAHGGP